jgi:hypothetical protein
MELVFSGIYRIIVKFQTNFHESGASGPRILNLNEFIDPF